MDGLIISDITFLRYAEVLTVGAYQKIGFSLSPGMEIGYVIMDAAEWEVDTERDASGFDAVYYGKLLDKAWGEVAFVFRRVVVRLVTEIANTRRLNATMDIDFFRYAVRVITGQLVRNSIEHEIHS